MRAAPRSLLHHRFRLSAAALLALCALAAGCGGDDPSAGAQGDDLGAGVAGIDGAAGAVDASDASGSDDVEPRADGASSDASGTDDDASVVDGADSGPGHDGDSGAGDADADASGSGDIAGDEDGGDVDAATAGSDGQDAAADSGATADAEDAAEDDSEADAGADDVDDDDVDDAAVAPDAAADADAAGCAPGPGCPQAPPCTNDLACAALAVPLCHLPSCDIPSGTCVAKPVLVGMACNDGVKCTINDVCTGGACKGKPLGCGDNNPCTADSCVDGVCVYDPVPIGMACPMGSCGAGGSCEAAAACVNDEQCNDGDECSWDKCEVGKCTYTAIADNAPCDDGDMCTPTTHEKCFGGSCINPINVCGCMSDFDCAIFDDADACNGGFACVATAKGKLCQPSVPPVTCSAPAGAPCVAMLCDAASGACKPSAAALCDDGNPCTTDSCAKPGCTHQPLADGAACSDGSACTGPDACAKGACLAGPAQPCDDGNPCTVDTCQAGGGCKHQLAAACTPCLAEPFASSTSESWASWGEDESFLQWKHWQTGTNEGRARVAWGKPAVVLAKNRATTLQLRRLMHEAQGPARLAFWWRGAWNEATCSTEKLVVAVNGKTMWQVCDSKAPAGPQPQGGPDGEGWRYVEIDLAAWRGVAFDVEFKVFVAKQSQAWGWIELDDVSVVGSCGPACLGADFENRGSVVSDPSSVLAQAWQLTSTAPGYLRWKHTGVGGHAGGGAMTVAYNGALPAGGPHHAELRMPQIVPAAKSVLRFATRVLEGGDADCSSDRLEVWLGDKLVTAACTTSPSWKVHQIDLAPWIGSPTDLRFVVTTADSAAPSGIFQLDSVTVTGACSYACWRENFEDPTSLAAWWKLTAAAGVPSWQRVADPADASNHVAEVSFAASVPPGQYSAFAPPGVYRWLSPVAGMTFSYRAQQQGGPSGCKQPVLQPMFVYLKGSLTLDSDMTDMSIADMWFASAPCPPASGWLEVSEDVGDIVRAHKSVPTLQAFSPGVQTSVRVDDLLVMCR